MVISVITTKLIVSALLGLLIGLEREIKHKPVGLKTTVIVSVISCLLTIVSIEAAYTFDRPAGTVMDPMRLTAQIVSGIGFLGAGVILIRKNESITGLTTASLMWGAAGLGIAIGAGFFQEAFTGAALILMSVVVIPLLISWCGPKVLREKGIRLRLTVEKDSDLTMLLKNIKAKQMSIKNVKVKDIDNGKHLMNIFVYVQERRYETDVYYDIRSIPNVLSVEVESL